MIRLDGSTPVRYGLRLNVDEKYTGLKRLLSKLCGLRPEQVLLAEVHTSNVKVQGRHWKCWGTGHSELELLWVVFYERETMQVSTVILLWLYY